MTIHPQNLKSIGSEQKVENQTMRNKTTQKLKTFPSSFFVCLKFCSICRSYLILVNIKQTDTFVLLITYKICMQKSFLSYIFLAFYFMWIKYRRSIKNEGNLNFTNFSKTTKWNEREFFNSRCQTFILKFCLKFI